MYRLLGWGRYGGLAGSEEEPHHELAARLKKRILEGSIELSVLGVLGSIGMLIVSIMSFVSDFLFLSPIRAVLMLYTFLGALALLTLEGIHRPEFFWFTCCCKTKINHWKIYLFQELHILATLGGRSFAYAFFGSILLADSSGWIGRIVGCYIFIIALAMIYVARKSTAMLVAMGTGLSQSELQARFTAHDKNNDGKLERTELAALCHDLGTTLTPRELESALQLFDTDQSGKIDQAEFLSWWYGDNWQRTLLSHHEPPKHHFPGASLFTNLSNVVEMM